MQHGTYEYNYVIVVWYILVYAVWYMHYLPRGSLNLEYETDGETCHSMVHCHLRSCPKKEREGYEIQAIASLWAFAPPHMMASISTSPPH